MVCLTIASASAGCLADGDRFVQVQIANNLDEPTQIKVWFDDALVVDVEQPVAEFETPTPAENLMWPRERVTVTVRVNASLQDHEETVDLPEDEAYVGVLVYTGGTTLRVIDQAKWWE